ncbi:MAG: thiamine-phosphate kinase [bacterium]|nr:thiamine-phosphate kinase [bacterium]
MHLNELSEQDVIKRLTSILMSDSPSRVSETDVLHSSREGRQPSSGSSRFKPPLMRGVRLGPGHDAAVVTPNAGFDLVITCDQQIEGTHFDLDLMGEEAVGRRALAAAVSDLAPFGATPLWATIAVAASPEVKLETLEQVYRGLTWAADELSAPFSSGGWSKLAFVGGDLATTRGPIYMDICVIGQRPSTWAPGGRAGAKPGETIYLSGPTGMAAGGFWLLKNQKTTFSSSEKLRKAFLWPEVELELGVRLWRDARLTTCADTSDSLGEQLRLLAEASDVGVQVSEDRLPLPPTLVEVAEAMGIEPVQLVLGGGEDFRLLLTGPAGLEQREKSLVPIGKVLPREEGVRLLGLDGVRRELPGPLFSHFGGSAT